ncbi:MAG TPA: AmmeMemoRadiSam system protein B [Deltaproteobacteria bacterium]|nr:AmmeMemoRadiSam system protein B [Deltaproteobacteria bacterium]
MEKPKMRLVEALPFIQDGKEMVLLRDPEGITEHSLVISRDVAFLLSLMDGTRTLRDIQVEYMRAFGELLYIERIQEFVETMDEHLLLFNEHYEKHVARLKMEYEGTEVRKPFLAGKSYSANRMELLMFLDEMFKETDEYEAKDIKMNKHPEIKGILAPHIDYDRGKEVYKKTYPYLRNLKKPLIVIFGTSHRTVSKMWSISLKDFETPLDIVLHSKEMEALIREHPVLSNYIDEWPHRCEHSIELQLPLLQFMIQDDFEILPILTGTMQEYINGEKEIDSKEIVDLVTGLHEVLQKSGKHFIIISGADLAHIGAQFGDRYPLDFTTLASSKTKDEILLEYIRKIDARGFFQSVRDEGDRRRICGLVPIFFQLSLLANSKCEIVGYKQWSDGASSVSFAGCIFF